MGLTSIMPYFSAYPSKAYFLQEIAIPLFDWLTSYPQSIQDPGSVV